MYGRIVWVEKRSGDGGPREVVSETPRLLHLDSSIWPRQLNKSHKGLTWFDTELDYREHQVRKLTSEVEDAEVALEAARADLLSAVSELSACRARS